MVFDNIVARINSLILIPGLFILSVSFAGLMYFDSLSQGLGFSNSSLFDQDFDHLFTKVFISDRHNIIMASATFILLAFIPFAIVYPKSLTFILNLSKIFVLILWHSLKLLNFPIKYLVFLLLFISPFLIPVLLAVLLVWSSSVKLSENKKLKKYKDETSRNVKDDPRYVESSTKLKESEEHFFKSYLMACALLPIFALWLGWVLYIGNQGQKHADIYLKSSDYKKVYLIDKTVFDAVFVSKVKNGYLFVLKDGEKNKEKASFIPDSAILRID